MKCFEPIELYHVLMLQNHINLFFIVKLSNRNEKIININIILRKKKRFFLELMEN